jgi:Methyl-accepting chemotaxis protein
MTKPRLKVKSITAKLLMPLFIVITAVIIGIEVFAFNLQNQIILDSVKTEALTGINSFISTDKNSDASIVTVKKALSDNYISQARLIAELIEKEKGLLNEASLKELAAGLNIDEINIVDGNGKIVYSNVKDFIGFDMNSSDQSREFMDLINNKGKSLAQEPQERGTDKALFQYIGFSRIDSPGVVQIGIKPAAIQNMTAMLDTNQYIKNLKLLSTGYFSVVDKNGLIVHHPQADMIGKKFDLAQKFIGKGDVDFVGTFNGSEKHYYVKQYNDEYVVAVVPTSEYTGSLRRLISGFIIAGIIAALASGILIYLLSRGIIIKPLKKIMALMGQAEKGDFTVKAENNSEDEIGRLSRSFNNMVGDINSLIKSVLEMIKQVRESADTLAATSEETAASTAEIANTIQEIASGATDSAKSAQAGTEAVGKLALEIKDVMENSGIMKKASSNSEVLNKKGIESMELVAGKFEENINIAGEVADSISKLSGKSRSIEEITNMITSIASQTNLLALNAAIEAARAGESGRGFAVVADEIKKLAEQSVSGADEIVRIIADIKNETSRAVKSMDSAKVIVDDCNAAISSTNEIYAEVGESFVKLAECIDVVDDNIRKMDKDRDKIVALIGNISATAEQSAASSEEVAATTEEQSAAVQQVTASAQELNTMTKQLYEIASKFKVE